MKTAIGRALLALGACGGIAVAGATLPSDPPQAKGKEFVADPRTAQLVAVGFEAVVADVHWIRAIQVIGRDQGVIGQSDVIGALLDVVTTLDPWVDHPYRFAAVWMTDDERAIHKANELIRRGIAHHPDDWRGYFYLAFNHFFYLDEQEEAARALKPALSLDGAPPYLTRLAARLESKGGGLDSAAAFLSEMARQAPNDDERNAYETALREVETERRARFLDAARAEFVRRHKRDIESVEELVAGGVLRSLPADPFGVGWELSAQTGEIVSKHVRYRYTVKIDGTSRALLDKFRERSRAQQGE